MTTTAATKAPLAPGQQLTCTAGSAFVVLQRVDNGLTGTKVFRVVVNQPTAVDGFDYTYGDEATARAEATRATVLFRAHRTVHGIAARRNELAMALATEEHRARRHMHSPSRMTAIRTEPATLLDLADAHQLHQRRARHTRTYAA